MAGVIINISASDKSGIIDARDLGNYLAEIVRSAMGEDIRVNVSTRDLPVNRVDTYKNVRLAIRKPWKGYEY